MEETASVSEQKVANKMIKDLAENRKYVLDNMVIFLADAGYDDGKRNALLKDKYDINPLVDNRHMWAKDEKTREIDNQPLAYNEDGELFYIKNIKTGEYEKLKYEIAQHDSSVDYACSIITSAQGGPQLLPSLRLEEEFFIVKDDEGNVIRESASVLHKTARTLIGIKNLDNGTQEAHIFIVTNEHPMDIYEARDLCKSYGLDSAMAFDGGSSTSLDYKNIHVTSTQDSGDTGRALKSFMIIKK